MWGMLMLNNNKTLQALWGAWTQVVTMLLHKLRAEGTINFVAVLVAHICSH